MKKLILIPLFLILLIGLANAHIVNFLQPDGLAVDDATLTITIYPGEKVNVTLVMNDVNEPTYRPPLDMSLSTSSNVTCLFNNNLTSIRYDDLQIPNTWYDNITVEAPSVLGNYTCNLYQSFFVETGSGGGGSSSYSGGSGGSSSHKDKVIKEEPIIEVLEYPNCRNDSYCLEKEECKVVSGEYYKQCVYSFEEEEFKVMILNENDLVELNKSNKTLYVEYEPPFNIITWFKNIFNKIWNFMGALHKNSRRATLRFCVQSLLLSKIILT